MNYIMSLCLNMIVKNESKNIIRLLESVYTILDTYCICDTGSTDNTIEKIQEFFDSKHINGKIVEEPFQNFEYNRTFALQQCVGMSDYVLLMDADMVLKIGNFNKSSMTHDCFYVFQGSEDFYYKNARIVRNAGFSYLGVTHEYLDLPNGHTTHCLPKDELFILDIGDGGSKANKFERDIELLTKGIEDDPTNVRYHFYLANSYNDSGNKEKAIEYYKKRAEMGGWYQEIWMSHFRLGTIYESYLPEMAIFHWLQCLQIIPNRIENLYEIIKYYRIHSKHKIALQFYVMAKNILKILDDNEKDNFLFLNNDVYTYKLEYEFSIIACYLGVHIVNDSLVKIFNHCNEEWIVRNTLSNMKFYKDKLLPDKVIDFTNKMVHNYIEFNSSSCSIIPMGDGYKMNVRYVNYKIEPDGNYLNCDKYIITLNKCYHLDADFEVMSEQLIHTDFEDRRYIGIEDVKLFGDKFIGTGYHQNNMLGLSYGTYDDFSFNELKCGFNNSECEKNWALYEGGIVYNWHPLTLCKLNGNVLEKEREKEVPKMFKHMRGSTNGFHYNDEIWFVTHCVSYEMPRHYYHFIVVFDSDMNLLRYSAPFKFEGEPIEYCLGIIVEDERVILTYSTWDRTTKIAIYNKNYIFSKVNIYANVRF
jgi:tetratricopeptide (TPR) repeat protein